MMAQAITYLQVFWIGMFFGLALRLYAGPGHDNLIMRVMSCAAAVLVLAGLFVNSINPENDGDE